MKQIRYKAKLLSVGVKLTDLVVVILVFANVWELANHGRLIGLETFNRVQLTTFHLAVLLFLAAMWYLVFSLMGLYNFRRLETWPKRLWRISMAVSLGVAGVMFLLNLLTVHGLRRPLPAAFWLGTLTVFLAYRSALWALFHRARTLGRNIRYVVIVGLSERAVKMWAGLERAHLGYKLLGFVDDGVPDEFVPNEFGGSYLTPLNRFSEFIAKHPVDEVILALPLKSHYEQAVQVIRHCAVQGIRVRLLTDLFDLPSGVDYYLERSGDLSFLTYDTDAHSEIQHDLKRIFDALAAALGLIFLSPIMAAIALAVWLSDGWPVFFSQERVGVNKRRFRMFKYRTMVRDAEQIQAQLEAENEASGAVFKIEDDPRVTKLGRILRRTSLDELPQLFNVLFGQMSLVGPRPLPIRDYERFYSDAHRRRFSVKPGVTGLWQVSGRSGITFEEWMRLDTYYVDRWSFWLDLRIIMKTLAVVIKMKGAY